MFGIFCLFTKFYKNRHFAHKFLETPNNVHADITRKNTHTRKHGLDMTDASQVRIEELLQCSNCNTPLGLKHVCITIGNIHMQDNTYVRCSASRYWT